MATQEENDLRARRAELSAEFLRLVDEANELRRAGNTGPEYQALSARITALRSERVAIDRKLAALEAQTPPPEPAPPATAAETVKDDAPAGPTTAPEQTVGADGRITQPTNTGPTNAAVTPTGENPEGVTSGTDATVKTTEQTQAITTESNNGQALKPPSAGASAEGTAGEAEAAGAVVKPGVAQPKDDGVPSATPQQVDANTEAQPNIKPRPNVLDQYASYSYSASVYLMTEAQYTRLLTSTKKTIDGYQLLFQSGGAPNNVGGIRPPNTTDAGFGAGNSEFGNDAAYSGPDGGRNFFFDNDFYIDSITIENVPPGKGTGSAHTISSLKFTLIEPNGITLLDRLYDAVANSAPTGPDGKVNYSVATFLMVIRFYGYDSEGNLEQVRSKPDQEGTSDPSAVIEKFIPFKMKGINWSVGSKLVSYEWDCVPVGQLIAAYASRGTIPYDVQLVDSTVGGLLGGAVKYSGTTGAAAAPGQSTTATTNANQSDAETRRLAAAGTTPAPAKANAAPTDKNTITAGLAGAMNEFQKKLVRDGIFTYADEYVIKFVGPDANKIRDAKLQLPNTKVDKSKTAAGAPATKDSQALDQARTSVDMVSRSFSITAGQQLLQAIELTIRNSSYIRDQSLVIVNPDGTQVPNPNARDKPLKWFVITMSAEPISELDPKRNDKAYRITYSIAAREVKNVISKYFPVSRFTGVHKSYPYWFTGENTAVLDYQESFNALYQLTVSGGPSEKNLAAQNREKYTSSMSDIVTYNYAPTSTESGSGADGRSNEPNANAAEVLYSPGDLRECKVKIVGDPAWIMQGSNFRMPNDEYFSGESLSTGFDPDGSISFDTQDVLFEIRWQRPEDYDLATGLADPYSQTQKKYNNRTALQSRVYQCKKVVSEFRQGRFEQTLEGAIYLFPIPNKTNAANPSAVADNNRPAPTVTNADRAAIRASAIQDNPREVASLAARYPPPFNSSVTGTTPTSSTAKGVESTLNPPKILAEPTLTQLQASPAYIAARRSGQTPEAALQAARQSFAAPAGGSPVTSNGQALATSKGNAPNRLPSSPTAVTPSNVSAARQGASNQSPTSPTNAANQKMAITK